MDEASNPAGKLSAALLAKGVHGSCPMCRHNDWAIQDRQPHSKIEVMNQDLEPYQSYGGFFPTYWIFCNNCGFIAQFLKSVVDGTPEPGEPEPNR
jgi:hypothetical protein